METSASNGILARIRPAMGGCIQNTACARLPCKSPALLAISKSASHSSLASPRRAHRIQSISSSLSLSPAGKKKASNKLPRLSEILDVAFREACDALAAKSRDEISLKSFSIAYLHACRRWHASPSAQRSRLDLAKAHDIAAGIGAAAAGRETQYWRTAMTWPALDCSATREITHRRREISRYLHLMRASGISRPAAPAHKASGVGGER